MTQSRAINGHSAVALDRSFFYPTSGGQPHDLGTLNGVPVIDVQVDDDGVVWHVLGQAALENPVLGEIDWQRRYDHMQQHSGQHLLSQAFFHKLGLETVSVHFGDDDSTLDLDVEDLNAEQLAAVEDFANAVIWENRPIRHYWVTDAELDQIPLRRPPKVTGRIRIVEIEQFDWSACGGTHVRATGEIGAIALLRTEKMRRQTRVHFLCGGRVLEDYRQRRAVLGEIASLLDTHYENAPELVEKLQAQNRDLDRQLRGQQEELIAFRARALLESARQVGKVRLVAQAMRGLDPSALKVLASTLQAEPRTVALLCCESNGKGTAIFARAADVELNVGQLLRDVLSQFGGGGGGRPDFAQGGGMSAEALEAVLATAVQKTLEQI
ncbi:MAG: DHHA1 domain-containing protein [Caldilineaceae bacterium]